MTRKRKSPDQIAKIKPEREALTPEYINSNFPVIGIKKLSTGVVVCRGSKANGGGYRSKQGGLKFGGTVKRGKVTELTRKSLSRLAFLARENSAMFSSMITLTYGGNWPIDGQVVKQDLNNFLTWMRRKYDNPPYLWFLEFQERGAPHFHVLTQMAPIFPMDRFHLADYWSNLITVGNGRFVSDRNIEAKMQERAKVLRVHFHPDTWQQLNSSYGAGRYVVKYAAKAHQKSVPEQYLDVGRFWGSSRDVKINSDQVEMVWMDEEELRQYLKMHGRGEEIDGWEIIPKYVYLFED